MLYRFLAKRKQLARVQRLLPEDTAKIWPWLSNTCRFRSTAGHPPSLSGTISASTWISRSWIVYRAQDVCEGARFPIEGERCVVSSVKRLEVDEKEEEVPGFWERPPGWMMV